MVYMRIDLFLHNLSHVLLPFLLCLLFSMLLETYDPILLWVSVFAGALAPDLDHLIMLRDYRFKSFFHFLSYVMSSDRYRKSFLIFHNLLVIFILPFFFPLLLLNIYVGLFLIAFHSHLILDLLFDFYAIGDFSSWKIRRRI